MAVRLPASVVKSLGLQEGDQVVIDCAIRPERHLIADESRHNALHRLKSLNWVLPTGFVFSRSELASEK